jgi:Outer membrane lipoprotein carrier protein LolA-like
MRQAADKLLLPMLLLVPMFVFGADTCDATLDSVIARLSEPAVVRGSFEQTRDIHILSKPLRSHGIFVLSDLGLYWQQQSSPVSSLIADGTRLVQKIGDGEPETIDESSSPMVLPFSRIFLGIFRGDETSLRQNFSIAFASRDCSWSVVLTPLAEPLSLAIASITLRGRDYIEEVTVRASSADETQIRFADVSTQSGGLSEHELELYAR